MKLRLDRILTSQGLCSRSEGTHLIKKGKVLFNGELIKSPKEKKETEGLVITFEGEEHLYTEHVYLVLNKPAGYECSDKPTDHPPVNELLTQLHRNRSIMSAGRLDLDTTGLLLFSDDGSFIHRIAAPKKHLTKTYRAQLVSPLTEKAAQQLLKGVRIDNDHRPAVALQVDGIDTTEVLLTIDEGRYHQVKRMFVAVGNKVLNLHRSKIGELQLPSDLEEGSWRNLSEEETNALFL